MTIGPDDTAAIRWLAQNSTVEMIFKDIEHLQTAAELLPAGTDIFIAKLPKQTWADSVTAAKAVRAVGLNPVPHIPAREIASREELTTLIEGCAREAQVTRVLLIAGDRQEPASKDFTASTHVLETGLLKPNGITSIYVAAHPEGNPNIPPDALREYEARKLALAKEQGLDLTFVSQVVFEPEPIIQFEKGLRARGVSNPYRAGLAGPASLMTLLRYAKICGVGASMSAITGGKGGLVGKLVGDKGPEGTVRSLAHAQSSGEVKLLGLHFFAFGGFMRTAKWVSDVAAGRFDLTDSDGFRIK